MAPSQTRMASVLVLIVIVNLAVVTSVPLFGWHPFGHKTVTETKTVNVNENKDVRLGRQLSVSGASAQANSFSSGGSPYPFNAYLGGIGGFPPISTSNAQAFSSSGSSGIPYGK